MDNRNYEKLLRLETAPEALEASCRYLATHIKPFLSILEPVLICFPDDGPASLGGVFKRAVEMCGAIAILWGPDYRWQELLRVAFDSHANTVIGAPHVLLGLMKLSRATGTPLYVYDVIACGDPFPRWMVNGMRQGLDCRVWGCYAVHYSPVIAGFSCAQDAGIHIREEIMEPVRGVDSGACPANRDRLFFRYKNGPDFIFDPKQTALVLQQPCSCGCDSPRVMEAASIGAFAGIRDSLEEMLLAWNSVLDYRASNTENGLKLEVVVIADEAIPEFPSCAHLTVRQWDPATDVPFAVADNYQWEE